MVDFTKSKMNHFSYADWNAYFEQNSIRRLAIPFQNDRLTEKEKERIFPSICKFEQGERSDGKYLKKTADRFAEKIHNKDYRQCIRYFIKEENVHSAYLKRYREHYQVSAKEYVTLDRIFRRLRRLGGLRCEVIVLATAEIIALSYYEALMNVTESCALKAICRQMLHDEIPHVMFQSYTLSHFDPKFPVTLIRVLFMEITSVAVWIGCYKVFVAAGWTFKKFIRHNRYYLEQSKKLSAV